MTTFLPRLLRFKELRGYSRDELGKKLGVTGKYIGMIERGEKVVDDDSTLARLLGMLEQQVPELGSGQASGEADTFPLKPVTLHHIPVISWAHAGEAVCYDELPKHWQDFIPSLCRGKRAFALKVEGDSMEPRCMSGDLACVDPDEELRNGCLVVAKLRDDGVLIRRYNRMPDNRVRLIPYNPLYPATDYQPGDFHWIYPVHSTVRREL